MGRVYFEIGVAQVLLWLESQSTVHTLIDKLTCRSICVTLDLRDWDVTDGTESRIEEPRPDRQIPLDYERSVGS